MSNIVQILVIGASMLIATTAAKAEVISLSSMSFNVYGNHLSTQDPAATNGALEPVVATNLYSGVLLPGGQKICRFSLVYQDSNGLENVTATLFRKRILVGSNALAVAQQIASVSSTGSLGTEQIAATSVIAAPIIDNASFFYFVKIFAKNFNTIPVGVQIVVKPTCP